MSGQIDVLFDHAQGKIHDISWDALALATEISSQTGCSLRVLVLGAVLDGLTRRISATHVESVLQVESPQLESYDPDCYSAALAEILQRDRPRMLLMGHTYQNIDLAPKLAARLQMGLVTDCVGFRPSAEGLVFVRRMFRNKLNASVQVHSDLTWLVTVQSGAGKGDRLEAGQAKIEKCSLDLHGVRARRRRLETIEGAKGAVDLSQAKVIVGVGRGIKKAENLALIRELAEVLGAEVGASRPVVDNEWLDRERQIGSSGQNVSPLLYIACGISGAIQHIVGMRGADYVVAINTDPNAPIFSVSNYGVVGDLFEVVPALIKQLRAIE